MSARKLGRIIGLVLALTAANLGGIGVASYVAEHSGGANAIASVVYQLADNTWG